MILDDVVLYEQFLAVGRSGTKPVHFKWKAELIIDNEVIPVLKVDTLERNSDFVNLYSDIIHLQILVPQSVLINLIQPARNNLKIRLAKEQNNRTGDSTKAVETYSQVFDAHLITTQSPTVKVRSGKSTGDGLDDLSQLATVELQLTDVELTEYRLVEVSGVYRNIRTDNLLRAMMSHPLAQRKQRRIGVDMVPGNNDRIYYQILLPNGIKLIELPMWLQENYGIYSSKIGYYLYQGFWYVYPLLDYTRFDKVKRNLTILKVPPDEMVGNDNSYVEQGDNLFVFATGDTKHTDNSEHILNNVGNGIRYVQTSNIVDQFRNHERGSSKITAGQNRREVILEKRPKGINLYKNADGLFTDNPWQELSTLTSGLAATIGVVWEYSNPELLYPGMPVKFLYKRNNKVVRIYGTLVGIDSITTTRQLATTDNRYVTSSSLVIHVEREGIPYQAGT